MTAAHSHTLELPGATLSYDVRDGTGPTVVALHGLGASRANDVASEIFDWSAAIGHGRRLVRYDARGHGRSAVEHPTPEDFTWPRLAEDLLALLDEVSPDAPVDAIGVSMGVGTILHAVVRAPERFRRLALVLPPTAWDSRAAQRDLYLQMAEIVEAQGAAALAAAVADALPLPLLAEGGWTLPPFALVEDAAATVLRGSALTDLPDADALAAIRQPVVLRPWIDDPGHPVSTAERLAELIPHASIDTMASAARVRDLTAEVAAFLGAGEVKAG